ncbi:hypothetical protein KAX17_14700 [Candidatus Bipolaricaulota bacterium]|nr:hypothetical protein [Candidatus Bipolaricaulota bacterium]
MDLEVAQSVGLETILAYAKDLKRTLKLGTLQERKAFLAGLIKEIRVDQENVEIEYQLPRPIEKTEEPLPSVLQSVVSGGENTTLNRTFVLTCAWS